MKNFPSLKKNVEFQVVYNNGKVYGNKYLVMYVLNNNKKYNRLGISISKKVGNSVIRHKKTRILREIFRLNKIKTAYDIIVIIRINAKNSDYNDIEKAYLHLLKLHKLNL